MGANSITDDEKRAKKVLPVGVPISALIAELGSHSQLKESAWGYAFLVTQAAPARVNIAGKRGGGN